MKIYDEIEMKLIKETFDMFINQIEDKNLKELIKDCKEMFVENQELLNENKKLINRIDKITNYLEQRKEEWNNCQDRENIRSCHYIMIIRDLLEILKGGE